MAHLLRDAAQKIEGKNTLPRAPGLVEPLEAGKREHEQRQDQGAPQDHGQRASAEPQPQQRDKQKEQQVQRLSEREVRKKFFHGCATGRLQNHSRNSSRMEARRKYGQKAKREKPLPEAA